MWQILLAAVLIAIIGSAAYQTWRKLRKGSACCGEHEAAVKRTPVQDRNKAHYPYRAALSVGGMTCRNCAIRVENALNALPGTWARVELDTKTAHILLKAEPDIPQLCRAVAQAGYAAQEQK